MSTTQPDTPHEHAPVDDDFEDSAIIGGRTGVIGKYQLCFQLASGGMARVYLARVQGPAGFEKLVALKRIHSHLADQPEFIEMFLDEARIASRINHPNVCQVFDFGQEDGNYYISMEFLLGETAGRLAGTINKSDYVGSARWGRVAARVVAEAAEGLHAAHELKGDKGESMQVVHRDISPHNLFVTFDGAVKVVDFGIASAQNRLHTTNAGTLKGRYAYMAPEQIQGADVDRRCDTWALGVTLWEMLTGKRLFKRKNDAETIMAVVYGPIPAPSSIHPELPKPLDAVVAKALTREPDARFQTARELGRAVNRALVEIGESTGKAEVSELMEELFSERHARRVQMIDEARTMQSGTIRRSPVDESLAMELESAESIEGTIEPTQMRRRRRRTGLTSLLLGILGGGVVTLLIMLMIRGGEDPPPVEAPPAAPVAAQEEPAVESVEPAPEPEVAPEPDPEPEPEEEVAAAAPEPAPAAPMRRRRAVRGPPGTVSVVTPGGWADIFFRGRRMGRTPARIQLPAGRQVLSLRPFGAQPARRVVVNVPAGGTARATLRVQR
jgi:serine/threonine-protein kinase